MLTIAALAAGHTTAQATVKTVKYRITAGTTDGNNNYTLTFELANDSDAPFDGFTSASVTVNKTSANYQTETDDGGSSDVTPVTPEA